MDWLRVTKILVPEGVELWDKVFIQEATELKIFLSQNGLLDITLKEIEGGYLIKGIFPNEESYYTSLVNSYNNENAQLRELYYTEHGITQEILYWGPAAEYIP